VREYESYFIGLQTLLRTRRAMAGRHAAYRSDMLIGDDELKLTEYYKREYLPSADGSATTVRLHIERSRRGAARSSRSRCHNDEGSPPRANSDDSK